MLICFGQNRLLIFHALSRHREELEVTRFLLSLYYTMRFLYFALAIKPNANKMYMQRK